MYNIHTDARDVNGARHGRTKGYNIFYHDVNFRAKHVIPVSVLFTLYILDSIILRMPVYFSQTEFKPQIIVTIPSRIARWIIIRLDTDVCSVLHGGRLKTSTLCLHKQVSRTE